jgi:hypothetical protein
MLEDNQQLVPLQQDQCGVCLRLYKDHDDEQAKCCMFVRQVMKIQCTDAQFDAYKDILRELVIFNNLTEAKQHTVEDLKKLFSQLLVHHGLKLRNSLTGQMVTLN